MALPWPLFAAELLGTGLLVSLGCSWVIINFGAGSPVAAWLPDPLARRALTGFLFGSTGAVIALSWVGRQSGAHLNPVVTLAFWVAGSLRGRYVLGYLLAQGLGSALGGLALLAWGVTGQSVAYAATVPGSAGSGAALLGEVVCTFLLILGLFACLGRPRLRPFAPLLFPPLYALMVALEAPLSGTSTNPARSLGSALPSGVWTDFCIYLAGPLLGAALALAALRWTGPLEVEVAKLYHFAHDPHRVFRAPGGRVNP